MFNKLQRYILNILIKFMPTEQAVEQFLELLAERLATPEVKNTIVALVMDTMNLDIDGEEKKILVKQRLQEVKGALGNSVQMTANWVLDTLIQTAVLKLVVGERSIFKKNN